MVERSSLALSSGEERHLTSEQKKGVLVLGYGGLSLVFDEITGSVSCGDIKTRLTEKRLDLLSMLAGRGEEGVLVEILQEEIWPDVEKDTSYKRLLNLANLTRKSLEELDPRLFDSLRLVIIKHEHGEFTSKLAWGVEVL